MKFGVDMRFFKVWGAIENCSRLLRWFMDCYTVHGWLSFKKTLYLTFTIGGAIFDTSVSSRSTIPGNIVDPPERTIRIDGDGDDGDDGDGDGDGYDDGDGDGGDDGDGDIISAQHKKEYSRLGRFVKDADVPTNKVKYS